MAKTKKADKNDMAVGGGVLLGIGVGFFLLEKSALYFLGSILLGLGLGLVISPLLSKIKTK